MTPAHHSLFKWWPWVDLDLFYGKAKFGNLGFSIGKSEICWFFSTFAACDLKLHKIMKICEYWRSRVISWPWPKVSYIWKLKTGFSQKPLGQSKPNFICKLSGSRKWKFIDMMLVTWSKMAAKPIYGKNPSKIFLSGTSGPISTKLGMKHWWLLRIIICSNDDPGLTLTYFMAGVKFGNIGLSIEKSENFWFFRTIAACDLKPIEIMKICEYWRSRSFLDLGPRSFAFEN